MTRRTHQLSTAVGFGALLLSGACSDSTGVTGDPLSQQEAFTIFAELQSAVADALGNVTTAPPARAGMFLTPLPKVTGTCDGGGTVSIEGDYNDNLDPITSTGTFTFTFVEGIDDCIVVANGTTFTINGAPNLAIDGDITVSGTFQITGTYEMDGAFQYTADDDRAGTCDVDVQIDLGTRTTSGTVCGEDVGT